MMDVQFHWTSLWFAGRSRNWELAKFYFDESRSHMIWLIRKSPVVRGQQDGKDVVRVTAAFARLGEGPGAGAGVDVDAGRDGLVFLDGTPPALPPPAECVGVPVGSFGLASIAERIEFRSAELPGWFLGHPSGRPASEFWMRFADGREADLLSLPLLVDSTAPSVLELGAGSTTIQLTVHLRAHPAPGWLACRATTRFVSGGYHEEDFEIWDSAGTMVAQSRQLGLILR